MFEDLLLNLIIIVSVILFLLWMIVIVYGGCIFLNTNMNFMMSAKFYNMLLTQFQTQPKILRSDNGGNI